MYKLIGFLMIIVLLFQSNIQAQDELPLWFEENFEDNSNRWTQWKEFGEWVYANTLFVKEEGPFRIEARMNYDRVENEFATYGLSWGRSDRYNYYYLELDKNQRFRVVRRKGGSLSVLQTWRKSKAIKLEASNVLMVERKENKWLFYINETEVLSMPVQEFFGTAVSFRSTYDNLKYEALNIYQAMGEVNMNEEVKNYQTKKENLGPSINSKYIDKFPIISPDGQYLYYLREDYPGDYGGQDIWFAERGFNGEWGAGQNVGPELNNKLSNFVNSVLPDNNTLCVNNAYQLAQTDHVLAFTKRTANGWSAPRLAMIRDLKRQGRWVSFYLGADGRTLVYTLARQEDNYGGRDLYVSFLGDDGNFSAPKNLGPTLNTPGNEHCPFLAADGKTLYFDSDGHPGIGGRDIFVSRRLDDSWTNWSTPENMGPAINTNKSDEGIMIPASGEYAYFVSNQNSLGALDIYRLKLPEALKPEPTAILRGKVTECEGQLGVGTIVQVFNDKEEQVAYANTHPVTGKYQLALPAGQPYRIKVLINESRYLETEDFVVDLSELQVYEERDIQSVCLTKISIPLQTIDTVKVEPPVPSEDLPELTPVYFDFDQHVLTAAAQRQLDSTITLLKAQPNWQLGLLGHTDAIGTLAYNEALSKKRIASVVDYLTEQGIARERITAELAKGETAPVAENDSPAGRAKNRRVEFEIRRESK